MHVPLEKFDKIGRLQHFFSIFSYSVPQLMVSVFTLLVPNKQYADLTPMNYPPNNPFLVF